MSVLFWLLLILVGFALLGGALIVVGWFALWYALVGLIIGGVARFLVRDTEGLSVLGTIIAGLIGAVGGGWIARVADFGSLLEFVSAVLVAAIVIAIARASAV